MRRDAARAALRPVHMLQIRKNVFPAYFRRAISVCNFMVPVHVRTLQTTGLHTLGVWGAGRTNEQHSRKQHSTFNKLKSECEWCIHRSTFNIQTFNIHLFRPSLRPSDLYSFREKRETPLFLLRALPCPSHTHMHHYVHFVVLLTSLVHTSQVKSSLYINNRQPYGSLSNVLRKPAGEDGSGRRWRRGSIMR